MLIFNIEIPMTSCNKEHPVFDTKYKKGFYTTIQSKLFYGKQKQQIRKQYDSLELRA